MSQIISGSCRCGNLRFDATDQPRLQFICHCADCRTATGNPYSTTAFFTRDTITISGDTRVQEFTSHRENRTTREACAECGAMVFDRSDGFPDLIGVLADRIDPPFTPTPTAQIWTDSRLPETDTFPELKAFPQGLS